MSIREIRVSLRLQLREQDHVADAFLAEESRKRGTQAVNADADAARRGHAVFERDEEKLFQVPPKCFNTSFRTTGRFTNTPGVSTFTP